jgi:hypothetical protein
MARLKMYQDEWWLRQRYVVQKKNIKEMAEEAGCSAQTIQNALEKAGFIKNGRSWGKK